MSTACFAYSGESMPPGRNPAGRPALFNKLGERDVRPVVSLLAELAFEGADILVHDLVLSEDRAGEGRTMPVRDVAVLVNRLDRSIKKQQLQAGLILPPMINENATRSLAHRKHRAFDEVLKPLGIGIPTRLVAEGNDIDEFLEEQAAGEFIVKPAGGSGGKGKQQVNREAVHELFERRKELFGDHVIQPALDFTLPLPSSLRPYDAASQEAFEGWSQSGNTKEMRIYGFHSPAETAVFPVCRAIEEGDHWFFVDPESVPEGLLNVSARAIARAAEITDARALFGTVDYGYSSLDAAAPDWHAIELNGKAPYMIGYDKHVGVADKLRELFADQIHATAIA